MRLRSSGTSRLLRCGLLALAATIPASTAAHARADEPPAIEAKNDVVYRTVDGRDLKLDLALPARGDGPFPAVLVIHGGAWRGGDKASSRPVLAELARRGYVAASPQYRFCPKDLFPAQVHDVKAAVRWLKSHAAEYKVDPDRLGATGFSAGGHLALLLGVTDPDDGLEGDVPAGTPDSRIRAVVNYFGPTDFFAEDIPEISRPLLRDFIGGSAEEKPELAKLASPVTFVTDDDPPILTFQGTKDPLVPHTQAFRLADAMTAAKAPGRVELLVGAGHGWGGDDLKRTLDETIAFFDRHLKP
jgi:acetyl esterase/lipase